MPLIRNKRVRGAGKGMQSQAAVSVMVEGAVQGVGFRRFAQRAALALKLAGYVENVKGGRVSIFVQGDKRRIDRFLASLRKAPPPMEVQEVAAKPSRFRPSVRSFQIRPGDMAVELQEGFGGMETEFRDYRREFRGFHQEFRDYRKDFDGFHGEFRDYRKEFRDYRSEFGGFASRTDESFKLMNSKYGEISEKLSAIMADLAAQAKHTTELLERFDAESKESRDRLDESLRLLRDAVERLPPRAQNP